MFIHLYDFEFHILIASQSNVGFIFIGKKLSTVSPKQQKLKLLSELENPKYVPNPEFVDEINSVQSSWKAAMYDEYNGMTVAQLMRRAGGLKRFDFPQPR